MDYMAWNIYCARLYANITAEGNDCIVGYVEINTWQTPKAYRHYVRLYDCVGLKECAFTF